MSNTRSSTSRELNSMLAASEIENETDVGFLISSYPWRKKHYCIFRDVLTSAKESQRDNSGALILLLLLYFKFMNADLSCSRTMAQNRLIGIDLTVPESWDDKYVFVESAYKYCPISTEIRINRQILVNLASLI